MIDFSNMLGRELLHATWSSDRRTVTFWFEGDFRRTFGVINGDGGRGVFTRLAKSPYAGGSETLLEIQETPDPSCRLFVTSKQAIALVHSGSELIDLADVFTKGANSDDCGYGTRNYTGLRIVGIGREALTRATRACFGLLRWEEVLSAGFTARGAYVRSVVTWHNPEILACVRSLASPWSADDTAEHFWNYLNGAMPIGLLPAPRRPRQGYRHVEQEPALYAPGPRYDSGLPNERREPEFIFHKGFELVVGNLLFALEIHPLWARGGPLDPHEDDSALRYAWGSTEIPPPKETP